MKKTMKLFGIAVGVLALVAVAQPANAACQAPFLITSINQAAGYYAYIINPTVTQGAGGEGVMGSSITDAFTGFFWGVGVGDPAAGVGADNGTFAALDWMYVYPNYPASVLTTWAADIGIDTCINLMGGLGERCQATFVQDVDTVTGSGMFALISTSDDPASGDYFLDNGGVDITMAPMPKVEITGSASTPADCRLGGTCTGVDLTVVGPSIADLTPGAFLDDAVACQGAGAGGVATLNGLVSGYRVYYVVLGRGAAVPTDFDATLWTPSGAGTIALGQPANISVDCSSGNSDVFIAWQMVLDSGFESPLLSDASTRIECGPNIAEPDQNREAPRRREGPRTRQR